eukprot:SM000025S08421  [mRNA]  locus=s25:594791:601686:- [translate_table: standard]
MVERAQDPDAGVQRLALESMRREIRTATSSMTSVPKPLKFLRAHFGALKDFFHTMPDTARENKEFLADVLSVLAMTMSPMEKRESVKYALLGSEDELGSWGHEYVRNLAGELGQEYWYRQHRGKPCDELMDLVEEIVPFHIKHNAEPEAVDLLLEVEALDLLVDQIELPNYQRTCLYLTSAASYVSEPEDVQTLEVAYKIYTKMGQHPEALRVALRLNNSDFVKATFRACTDSLKRKQLAYILARQGFVLDLEDDKTLVPKDDFESVQEILSNAGLSTAYLALARDLDVMEAKLPEDIYKAHLIDGRAGAASAVDSARQNLAATFVNGLVNAGFGQDKLMTATSESTSGGGGWLFKNKEHGKISATASLGLILLWDVDGGLTQIDKYLYSSDNNIVAGALLGIGVLNAGVRTEFDPAYALLSESVEKEDATVRNGAIIGLGLAYAGSQKQDFLGLLTPVITDSKVGVDVAGFAALALGLVYVGSCNEDAAQAIAAVDATVEVAKTLNPRISRYCQVTLESCAYAGTGNVLKVQKLLSLCADHLEGEHDNFQVPAVLGIALIAMGEELGQEMAIRSLEHLLQYGDPNIRRAVPLAMGLLSISNPKMTVMDTLSRLSHDSDSEVAMGAIIGMGLIGAGTNNARIAGMLRSLSSYYYKDPSLLFCVRIGQGLVHLGKGLLTLNPYHSDRFLLSNVAVAGLAAFLHGCLDMKSIILGRYHYCLYFLVIAMQPRMLMTVGEDLRPLPVAVRVGQAVDVVGQAGRPKSITGFQTHTTPVLLVTGERAELATDKYVALTTVLEGHVILKKNPDFVEDHLSS